jgi:hypothetical protein
LSGFLCPDCGNERTFLAAHCPHCRSDANPIEGPELVVFNLENGAPTVEEAIRTVDHVIDRALACGVRGLVVVHGYGASGRGGAIRHAFRDGLERNFWAHKLADQATGESLRQGGEDYARITARRPWLKKGLRRDMLGNPGITVLVLQKAAGA